MMVERLDTTTLQRIDEKFYELARAALFRSLTGVNLVNDPAVHVDPGRILEAFNLSGEILRKGHDSVIYDAADTLWHSCICLVRCLYFPEDARVVVLSNGKICVIDAEQQFNALNNNIEYLQKLLDQVSG